MQYTIDSKNLPCLPGNDNLHAITAQKKYTVRVDFTTVGGDTRYEEFKDFAVANEVDKYKLNLGSFSGTAGKKNTHFVLSC